MNLLSVSASWHRRKAEPRSDSIRFAYLQVSHSPAGTTFGGAAAAGIYTRITIACPQAKQSDKRVGCWLSDFQPAAPFGSIRNRKRCVAAETQVRNGVRDRS